MTRKPERTSTSDLWLASLLQSEAKANLVDVQVTNIGRKSVFFTFEGENLSQTVQEYCNKKAFANVTSLRQSMNDLRDLIFAQKKY